MSKIARQMIGEAKLPYWERDAIKRHEDELERIRRTFGHMKQEPDEKQARLIRLYHRRGEYRKIIDYCQERGLNPNHVIQQAQSQKFEDGD